MVSIDSELRPGDVGAIVEQHGRLYRAEHQLDERFEAYVAAGLAAAVGVRAGVGTTDAANATESAEQSQPDPPARFWLVREGDRLVGSAAVCSARAGWGQFRWFLLEPSIRGRGMGAQLLDLAVEHSRAMGYRALFLWTFDALETAARLYRRAGFVETQRLPETEQWGAPVTEVRYDLAAPFPATVRREVARRSTARESSPYFRRF